jgi:hypothetical protein
MFYRSAYHAASYPLKRLVDVLEALVLPSKCVRAVKKIEDFAWKPMPSQFLHRLYRLFISATHVVSFPDASKRADKKTLYVIEHVDGSSSLSRTSDTHAHSNQKQQQQQQYIAVVNGRLDASLAIGSFQDSLTPDNAFSVAEVVTAACLCAKLSPERLVCAFARDLRLRLEVIDAETMDEVLFENDQVVCLR